MNKRARGTTGPWFPTPPAEYSRNITSEKVTVTEFRVSGRQKYRNSETGFDCLDSSNKITVKITLESTDTDYIGDPPSITLMSTFTSGYPNPDQAGDSRPPRF